MRDVNETHDTNEGLGELRRNERARSSTRRDTERI